MAGTGRLTGAARDPAPALSPPPVSHQRGSRSWVKASQVPSSHISPAEAFHTSVNIVNKPRGRVGSFDKRERERNKHRHER